MTPLEPDTLDLIYLLHRAGLRMRALGNIDGLVVERSQYNDRLFPFKIYYVSNLRNKAIGTSARMSIELMMMYVEQVCILDKRRLRRIEHLDINDLPTYGVSQSYDPEKLKVFPV